MPEVSYVSLMQTSPGPWNPLFRRTWRSGSGTHRSWSSRSDRARLAGLTLGGITGQFQAALDGRIGVAINGSIVIAGGAGLSAMLSLFFKPAAYHLIQRLRSLRTRELVPG